MPNIWITWENQRRNKGISLALDWPLHELLFHEPRIIRYPLSIFRTIKLIRKNRPRILAVQNPSIVLAVLALVMRNFFNYRTIIDAHNAGIYPSEGRSPVLNAISRWIQKKADLTIVTNQELKSVVEGNGGKAFVLPDRLPSVPEIKTSPLGDEGFNVVFVCTYSTDEPYEEVFKAAGMVSKNVRIYVTGKYPSKISPTSLPSNIKLLGYVSEDNFWSLLSSADLIMDLTLREGCLVCGAYEGVSLLKPLILSDTKILRSYFSEGCVYVAPNAESISAGINLAINHIEAMKTGIRHLKTKLEKTWECTLQDLKRTIEEIK